MCLPQGYWPDPYGRGQPLVKFNKTLYGIKQANREYFEEVYDFIVHELRLQPSIAAPGPFFGGRLSETDGVLIPVYVDSIIIISSLQHVTSISNRLYKRFKGDSCVPVPDKFK
jgi:hypothetical protein